MMYDEDLMDSTQKRLTWDAEASPGVNGLKLVKVAALTVGGVA